MQKNYWLWFEKAIRQNHSPPFWYLFGLCNAYGDSGLYQAAVATGKKLVANYSDHSAGKMANGRYTWNDSTYDTNTQPADYGLEHFMLQRQGLIFSKIDMLYSEIYERRMIKEINLYRINLDQCCFKNMIYARGDHFLDRDRLELERRIIDLEQDKRREASNYFRDISFSGRKQIELS